MPLRFDPHSKKSTIGRSVRAATGFVSRVSPSLATRLATWLFLRPLRHRRPPREADWVGPATRHTLPTDAGPLAVWVWGGGGRTVLLAHGWSGRGLQLGALAGPLVECGFRVVAFDAPGHGESAGHSSSLPHLAAAISAVGRRFGPVEAVVAHSLGAAATLVALTRHDLEASRVVLISPPSRFADVLARFSQVTGLSPKVVERMRRRIEARFGFSWEAAEPLRLAPDLSTTAALVLHDRDDREIPWHEGAELAAAWPGARLVTTEHLGHHRLLRAPEVVAQTVAFLAEESTPASARPPLSKAPTLAPSPPAEAPAPSGRRLPAGRPFFGLRFDLSSLRLEDRDIAADLAYGRD